MSDLTSHYALYGNNDYRDPLELFNIKDYSNSTHRDLNLRGEPVFIAYISEIDKSIFSEVPEFNLDFNPYLSEFNQERFSDLFTSIADNSRMQDFIIVQLYNEEPYWRVFIPSNVKELVKDEKGKYISAKVTWYDVDFPQVVKGHTGMYEDELKIGDEYSCWLFSFNSSTNTGRSGFADVSQGLWTLIIQLRAIRQQLILLSSKPSFVHFVFGDSAKDADIDAIVSEADRVNVANGIGAKESVLKEIKPITTQAATIDYICNAKTNLYKEIAMTTHLPAAFFMGEREAGSGNAGNNVTADSVEVERKKEMIFDRLKPLIFSIIKSRFGIVVTDAKIGTAIKSEEITNEKLEENTDENKSINSEDKSTDNGTKKVPINQ